MFVRIYKRFLMIELTPSPPPFLFELFQADWTSCSSLTYLSIQYLAETFVGDTKKLFVPLILIPNMKKSFHHVSVEYWKKNNIFIVYIQQLTWMQIAIYSLILVKRSKCLIEIHTCTMHIVHILTIFFFYMQWSLIDRKCELK